MPPSSNDFSAKDSGPALFGVLTTTSFFLVSLVLAGVPKLSSSLFAWLGSFGGSPWNCSFLSERIPYSRGCDFCFGVG